MATNQQALLEYIKQTSGQSNVLTIPRIFIKLTGSLQSALFLSQCIYWSDRGGRKDGSFYKSYKEWEDETSLTRREIDNARDDCKAFITTELHRANGAPTLHYRVNFDALVDAIARFVMNERKQEQEQQQPDLPKIANGFVQNEQMDLYKNGKCLTEITHRLINPATTAETTRPEIFTIYEQNIGALTPLVAEELKAIDAEHPQTWPDDWFTQAVLEATQANARNLRYVKAVIASWQQNGYKADTRKRQQAPAARKPKRDFFAELEAA